MSSTAMSSTNVPNTDINSISEGSSISAGGTNAPNLDTMKLFMRTITEAVKTTLPTITTTTGATPAETAAATVTTTQTVQMSQIPVNAKSLSYASTLAPTAFVDGMDVSSTPSNMLSVSELSLSLQHFGIIDYSVFVLMLIICALIGFYFGFIERKKKRLNMERRGSEALDYLVGGRKMKVFPVSLSLVASFVSGISLLGTSTEIYVYGTQYAFILITLAISGVVSWYVFLPVFCNLKLTSTYEYLEMRFGKELRVFGSVLFSVGTILWLPIVIFVPALAFNQVTGVNIHIITPAVCVVCIFYTCVGGLKAVVWTDVIQTVVMLGAIIVVIIKGTANVGGLSVVLQRNWDSGRIELPTFTWDPTERVSMMSIFGGSLTYFIVSTSANQVIIQRYLALPGMKEVKRAVIYFTVGVIALNGLCFYNGLLIFATYHDCDPLSTTLAKAKDQLVPLLVMDVLRVFPGMAGLFVAGVFSAALSSLSTGLNSLSAVVLEDYIKPMRKTPLSEYQTAIIMRASVVIIGIVCVILVFVVERMGTVLQLTVTLTSITAGPLLGMFLMGLLLPWVNSKSALTGSVISFILMTWICAKGQMAIASGRLSYPVKSFTTEGCTYLFDEIVTPKNATFAAERMKTFAERLPEYIFHMSFLFYTTTGTFLTLLFSCVSMLFFGRNDPSTMDVALFSPCIRKFIKPVEYVTVNSDEQAVINGFNFEKPLKA